PDVLVVAEGQAHRVPHARSVVQSVPGVLGDDARRARRHREAHPPGRAARQGHLRDVARGAEGSAVGAGVARRGAEVAARGSRVPAQGRRVHARRARYVDRVQDGGGGRSGAPAPGAARVLAVLRLLIVAQSPNVSDRRPLSRRGRPSFLRPKRPVSIRPATVPCWASPPTSGTSATGGGEREWSQLTAATVMSPMPTTRWGTAKGIEK